MLEIVLIENCGRRRVVWWINIYAVDSLLIALAEHPKCLKIVSMNDETVSCVVDVFDAGNQSVAKRPVKKGRVDKKVRIGSEKFSSQRLRVSRRKDSVSELVDGKESNPLLALSLVCGNLGVKIVPARGPR